MIRKAVAAEREAATTDPFEIECTDIAERWAIGHVVQGCYIEEYHHWEKAIKQYFKGQRQLNGLTDDFDWKSGNLSLVKRAIAALAFFGTAVDQEMMNAIDAMREKVNWLKHDPLSCHVEERDYETQTKTFAAFWDTLLEIEARQFA